MYILYFCFLINVKWFIAYWCIVHSQMSIIVKYFTILGTTCLLKGADGLKNMFMTYCNTFVHCGWAPDCCLLTRQNVRSSQCLLQSYIFVIKYLIFLCWAQVALTSSFIIWSFGPLWAHNYNLLTEHIWLCLNLESRPKMTGPFPSETLRLRHGMEKKIYLYFEFLNIYLSIWEIFKRI